MGGPSEGWIHIEQAIGRGNVWITKRGFKEGRGVRGDCRAHRA